MLRLLAKFLSRAFPPRLAKPWRQGSAGGGACDASAKAGPDLRHALSETYLRGEGLEIGALHGPLWTGEAAVVRYVDRLGVEELRRHYPELDVHELVPVDIIDDGETLSKVDDETQDFIVANHFLEHCENPLGTIRNHLAKLKAGGVLYYAVPDKHQIFDKDRPVTTFQHLVGDDREGPERSRTAHFEEWVRLVEPHFGRIRQSAAEIDARARDLMEMNYSIHFHVWDENAFHHFLTTCRDYLGCSFDIVEFQRNGAEIIVILRKT